VVNPHRHRGPEDVDEVVQHTDAGDGRSQRAHWDPGVEAPGPEEGRLR